MGVGVRSCGVWQLANPLAVWEVCEKWREGVVRGGGREVCEGWREGGNVMSVME